MTAHPAAILIGLENAISLTIVRELGERGVPVHGVARAPGAIAAASRHCAGVSIRPAAPIARWLPDLIARTGARAVFAIAETDLIELAALPAMLGECHMLVPRGEPLARVLDKLQTLEVAGTLGIDVPQTWQPRAGDDFARHAAAMQFPVVAKWANPPAVIPLLEAAGLPWFKTEYVHTPAALLTLLDRHRAIGQWPLVQQYCRGVGVGQMLFMADGQATLRFQHRRLHEWPPEGGVSTLCRAEPRDAHGAQMRQSERLLQALDWAGPAMVEYRHDAQSGRYWLMEVNGRFWGSLPLASRSGARFAWEAYRRAVLNDHRPAPAPDDRLRARYMVPETKRLLRVLMAPGRIADPYFRRRPMADLLTYLLDFVRPHTHFYVFALSDPRPWMRDMAQMIRKAARRERR